MNNTTKNDQTAGIIDLLRLTLGKLLAESVERMPKEAAAEAKRRCAAPDAKARYVIDLPGPNIAFYLGDDKRPLFEIKGAELGDVTQQQIDAVLSAGEA